MSPPRSEIADYLERTCPGARTTAIVGDASTRSFWRVRLPDGETRVVMDYGAPFEGTSPDVELTRIFREAGLPVAEILDVAGDSGCLLLEDLGDRTLESTVSESHGRLRPDARAWIERAVMLAARVATVGTPVLARSERKQGPALDEQRFRFEMDHFVQHYVEALHGVTPSNELRPALHALADRAAETPRRVLCHRDFHSRNLMVLPDLSLAMVDIQDARWGPDSYDLASLLRDAYLDVDEAWIDSLVELYLATLGQAPPPKFRERLDRVSLQRMIKALGTFAYQATVRHEPRYLEAVPRTRTRLRALLPRVAGGSELLALCDDDGLLAPQHD